MRDRSRDEGIEWVGRRQADAAGLRVDESPVGWKGRAKGLRREPRGEGHAVGRNGGHRARVDAQGRWKEGTPEGVGREETPESARVTRKNMR